MPLLTIIEMLREVFPRVGRIGWRSKWQAPLATLTDPRAGSSIPCAEFVFCGFLRFLWVRATSLSKLTLRPNSARMVLWGNLHKMGRRPRSHRRARRVLHQSRSDLPADFAVPVTLPRPTLPQLLPRRLREIRTRTKVGPRRPERLLAQRRRHGQTRAVRDAIAQCGGPGQRLAI